MAQSASNWMIWARFEEWSSAFAQRCRTEVSLWLWNAFALALDSPGGGFEGQMAQPHGASEAQTRQSLRFRVMDVGTFGCRFSSPRPRLPPRRVCPPPRDGHSEGPWPRVGAGTDSACTRPRSERRVTAPASTIAPSGGGQPSLVTPQSVDVPVVQRDGLVLTSLKINTVQIVSDIPSLVRLEVAGRRFDGTAVVGLNTSAQVRQAVADSRS